MKLRWLVFSFLLLLYPAKMQTVTAVSGPPPNVDTVGVSVIGTPGLTTYCYYVIARYPVGNANVSNPGCTTLAPNTLSSSNYNRVTFNPVGGGVIGYDVLRLTGNNAFTFPSSGTCTACLFASNTLFTSLNDQSFGSLSSYTLNSPVSNGSVTWKVNNKDYSTPVTEVNGNAGNIEITTDITKPTVTPPVGKTMKYSNNGKICSLDSSNNELCTGGTGGGSGITQLTGDVTTPSSSSGSTVATLPTVNDTVGTCSVDSTHVGRAVYNAKGQVTHCDSIAISGAGGGASSTIQLNDWKTTRVSATQLSTGTGCLPGASCNLGTNGTNPHQFTNGPFLINLANSNSGSTCMYIDPAFNVKVNYGGGLAAGDITVSGNMTKVSGSASCPTDGSYIVGIWDVVTGAFAATGASDLQNLSSFAQILTPPAQGTGIVVTTSAGISTVAINTALVGRVYSCTGGPTGTPTTNVPNPSTQGSTCFDYTSGPPVNEWICVVAANCVNAADWKAK